MSWMPFSIGLNVLFIGFLVFVLLKAFSYEENGLGFWVVRIFALYLLTKYVTLFSEMLDTGFFLIGGGLLFIGGAWFLEKNKANLIYLMKNELGQQTTISEYDSYS
jgi:uncharacterized membrane protein